MKHLLFSIVVVIIYMLVACEEPDNTAPTVTVIYPAQETSVSEVVGVTCVATDNVGIEKVELWLDGVSTGLTDNTEPYSIAWNTTQYVDGSTHVVTVRAYDMNDNKGDSEPVTITIDQTNAYPMAINVNSVHYTLTEMTVNWSRSSDNDFASYELLYSETNGGIQSSLGIFTDINSTSFSLTDFDPFIENWFQIRVTDIWGLQTIGSRKANTIESAPTAAFSFTPNNGYTGTLFSFDASQCYDVNESDSQLGVRWDWENDGVWDSEFTTTKTASHQYLTPGTYTVSMEVQDSRGLSETMEKPISVIEAVGSVTDIDGNIYQTIVIGGQEWMMENLRVSRYRNGDSIATGFSNPEWQFLYGTEIAAYAVLDDEESNAEIYGYLYNGCAFNSGKKLAPTGWHIPTDDEWKELELYLGMSQEEVDLGDGFRGTNEGSKIAGNADLWYSGELENNNEFGLSGFTALPGGHRSIYGQYSNGGEEGHFWSSTQAGDYGVPFRMLTRDNSKIYRYVENKYAGLSVRCVRD